MDIKKAVFKICLYTGLLLNLIIFNTGFLMGGIYVWTATAFDLLVAIAVVPMLIDRTKEEAFINDLWVIARLKVRRIGRPLSKF